MTHYHILIMSNLNSFFIFINYKFNLSDSDKSRCMKSIQLLTMQVRFKSIKNQNRIESTVDDFESNLNHVLVVRF